MKKSKILVFLFLSFLLVGCDKQIKTSEGNNISVSSMIHEHCERVGNGTNGSKVEMSYELYYQEDVLQVLESYETVLSNDSDVLTLYEDAYQNIHDHYDGLEYYDTSIEKDSEHVTSHMIIQYNKIDIARLIQIEGEEHNTFENKVPKVSKWKELAKKIGTKCSVVEE